MGVDVRDAQGPCGPSPHPWPAQHQKAFEAKVPEPEVPEPAEPSVLTCPITQTMYRDPVFVPESGNTYERQALEQYWASCVPPRDPLTNTVLQQRTVHTNWGIRREVQSFLEQHPSYLPQGWETRLIPRLELSQPKRRPSPARLTRTCFCIFIVLCSLVLVLRHVYQESLWPRLSLAEDIEGDVSYLKVPKGSRLEAREVNGRLIVKIPPAGLQLDIMGQVLFSILWLAFVCYWTIAAVSSGVPWTFIPFSVPFWVVGFMLLFSTILTPSLSQTLTAGTTDYQVTSQVSRLSLSQVTANVTDLQEKPGLLCMSDADCRLVLQDGVQEVVFGSDLRPAEVRWIQKQLCRYWGGDSSQCLERSTLNADFEPIS